MVMWYLVGEMGIKSSKVPFEANGQSIELQSDYNGPVMDSPWSRIELSAQFLSVPRMLGTKFFFGMRVLRGHTRSKNVWPWKVTISGSNKPCPKCDFENWWALCSMSRALHLKKWDFLTFKTGLFRFHQKKCVWHVYLLEFADLFREAILFSF